MYPKKRKEKRTYNKKVEEFERRKVAKFASWGDFKINKSCRLYKGNNYDDMLQIQLVFFFLGSPPFYYTP
jgi:hypothetical protein